MNQGLALRVLGEVMNWDDDRAREEFSWLRLMSEFKYDTYAAFIAGLHFVESLSYWLQQFHPDEREVAYEFVRNELVFVSAAEMQHLVELAYPETIRRRLLQAVASQLGVALPKVWTHPDAVSAYDTFRRKTLFLALSDGARIDAFRRANAGTISNEQVVAATQINAEKWAALLEDLRSDLNQRDARFSFVFLLDDFVGTGTTLIRQDGDRWKGRLARFWEESQQVMGTHFDEGWTLGVHHYIGTSQALQTITARQMLRLAVGGSGNWFPRVEFTFGCILPDDLSVTDARLPNFVALAEKYYDPGIETKHTQVGGESVHLGFGGCVQKGHQAGRNRFPSVALLWAESDGSADHPAMRPLFRRRQRHS